MNPAEKLLPEDLLLRAEGRRSYARFAPAGHLAAAARLNGLSGWHTARRLVADIGIGGVSAWLSPRELEQVVIGDKVYVELYLPERAYLLTGQAAHRRVLPGSYWTRRVLGVSFLDSPDLRRMRGDLVNYLLQLREAGAEVAG